jgi:hypothetical protein
MMDLTLVLAGTALLAMGVLLSLWLPRGLSLSLVAALNAPQFYTFAVFGVYFSLAQFASLAVWPALASRQIWQHGWVRAAGTLILIQSISTVWAEVPALGLRNVIYTLPFLFVAAATLALAQENEKLLRKALTVGLLVSAAEALLIMLFRISPSLELSFLNSGIARLFVSANVLAELGNGAYTIFDPTKAGGVFVNANVAAAYMGFCGFLAWGCAGLFKSRWLTAVAVLDLLSVPFAGSKAGVGLCALMLGLLLVLHLIKKRRIGLGAAAAVSFGAGLLVVVLYLGAQAFLQSRYVGNSTETLGTRFVIWEFGLSVLKTSPLTGLGFGGWEKAWPTYALSHGSNPIFPPHNALLALFVQSGVSALIAGLLFALLTLRFIWRASNTLDLPVRRYALGVLCGVCWLFLQAQGENFGLIGEVHLTQFMALALGYLVYLNGRELMTYDK